MDAQYTLPKDKVVRQLTRDYEKSNAGTSSILHEEVAQTIASAKLYLRMAQKGHQDSAALINKDLHSEKFRSKK